MAEIQSIRTIYAGVEFRSRLEARWAVFFDAMGIPWRYEPRRFPLEGKGSYLPDFRLWDVYYVEVKPDRYATDDPEGYGILAALVLLKQFTKQKDQDAIFLHGPPRIRAYSLVLDGHLGESVDLSRLAAVGPGYSHPTNSDGFEFFDRDAFKSGVTAAATYNWAVSA